MPKHSEDAISNEPIILIGSGGVPVGVRGLSRMPGRRGATSSILSWSRMTERDAAARREGEPGDETAGIDAVTGKPIVVPERSAACLRDRATFHPITHGRHCPCSPCKREDWSSIAAPCGMHGSDCPPVYAPIPDERRAFAIRLARGPVVSDHGQPLPTRDAADDLRLRIEEMLGETGRVIEVERV